ncbi:hypothetical protein [Geoglobus acetivorans]|uniref:Uncharacterized protein n=1 Tax=Geoglobus acetivorans TaxID=565033 RepID=A0ABZ3GZI8_GEOAI|nr:hypothetical protein [Geoglobus acetivorans]
MRIIRSINNHAVSPVLGLVLAFAIIVGGIGVVQQFFVPVWLKNEESLHYFEVKKEFEKLDEKIIEAANYGSSVLNIYLDTNYPKYPFLITPSKASSSIKIVKIGEMESSLLSRKINITAFVLEPRYHYMNVPSETMILGEYFAGGSDIGGMDLYQNGKVTLLIFESDEKTVSGNAKLVLDGFGEYRIKNSAWFNISVNDGYEWYVKHLYSVLSETDLIVSADTNSYRWINFTVSPDTETLMYFAGSGLNISNEPAPVKYTLGSFNLTDSDGSSTTLSDGSAVTVDLSSTRDLKSSPSFYITGTTVPNAAIKVNITYNTGSGTISQSFTWYSDSNGVFQLPIVPPVGDNGERESPKMPPWVEDTVATVANIQLTFPDGSTTDYTINFVFKNEEENKKHGNGK